MYSDSNDSDCGYSNARDSIEHFKLLFIIMQSDLKRLEEMEVTELKKFSDFLSYLLTLEYITICDKKYERTEVKTLLSAVRDILSLYEEDIFELEEIPGMLAELAQCQEDVRNSENNSELYKLLAEGADIEVCLKDLSQEDLTRYLSCLNDTLTKHAALVAIKCQCGLKNSAHGDYRELTNHEWESDRDKKTVLSSLIATVKRMQQ